MTIRILVIFVNWRHALKIQVNIGYPLERCWESGEGRDSASLELLWYSSDLSLSTVPVGQLR